MVRGNPCDEKPLRIARNPRRDSNDLRRSLAFAIDHFGKILAQGAMEIDLGKSKICHRRRLEGMQNLSGINFAGPKAIEQFTGFFRCQSAEDASPRGVLNTKLLSRSDADAGEKAASDSGTGKRR